MSLAIADLIVGIIVMPISSFDFIADSGQGNFLMNTDSRKDTNNYLNRFRFIFFIY